MPLFNYSKTTAKESGDIFDNRECVDLANGVLAY